MVRDLHNNIYQPLLQGIHCEGIFGRGVCESEVTKTLQLRQSIIDAGKDDPAVPSGHMYSPTSVDKESAQKVADILQECVDIADGNTGVFMSELQRVIKDTPLIRRK